MSTLQWIGLALTLPVLAFTAWVIVQVLIHVVQDMFRTWSRWDVTAAVVLFGFIAGLFLMVVGCGYQEWNETECFNGCEPPQGGEADEPNHTVVGPAGNPGPAGRDGTPGRDGQPGSDGTPGRDGTDGAAGPTGVAGVPGPEGAAGTTGSPGAQGPAGTPGATGPAGPTGPAGTQGVNGVNGSNGLPGPTVPAGASGSSGEDGIGCTVWYIAGDQRCGVAIQCGDDPAIWEIPGPRYARPMCDH